MLVGISLWKTEALSQIAKRFNCMTKRETMNGEMYI